MLAVVLIDHAEPAILEEMIRNGRMRTLAALCSHGIQLGLTSDGSCLPESVTHTFLKGANPARHGIYAPQQLMPGTSSYRSASTIKSAVPPIWSVLSARKRNCCVFDLSHGLTTDTYRGKLISSWTNAGSTQADSHPAGLMKEMKQRFGKHPQPGPIKPPLAANEYEGVRDRLLEAVRLRTEAARWMLEDKSDFFIASYLESEIAAQQFWHLTDPRHHLYAEANAKMGRQSIEKVYEAIDTGIGRLQESLRPKSTLIVLTLHGIRTNYTGSHLLPKWLALREGRRPKTAWLSRLAPSGSTSLGHLVESHLPESVAKGLLQNRFPVFGDVFLLPGSTGPALLRVNLEGREPQGTVHHETYEQTLDMLKEDLLALKNPVTHEAAVQEIVFPHKRFEGPRQDSLPDMIVCWRDDGPIDALECPRLGLMAGGTPFSDTPSVIPTDKGFAIISGPGLRPQTIDKARKVADLNSTFYTMLGEMKPDHVEGRSLLRDSLTRSKRPKS